MRYKFFSSLLAFVCIVFQNASAEVSEEQVQLFVGHVQASIQNAELGISQLSPEVLALDGMSSNKVRHLLNNLCSMKGTRYLEIGCFKGSTWVSALYHNEEYADSVYAIDNWSEFGGPEMEFLTNAGKFLGKFDYRYFSTDCFSLDPKKAIHKPVNIYFYDGNHSAIAQEMALTHFNEVLDDIFILVVDDWNWEEVKTGTFSGLAKLNYQVVYSAELPARFNMDRENWWNGLYIAVIRKN